MSKRFLGFVPLIIFALFIVCIAYFVFQPNITLTEETAAPTFTPTALSSPAVVVGPLPSTNTPTPVPLPSPTSIPPTPVPSPTPTSIPPTPTPVPSPTLTPIPPTSTPTPPDAVVLAEELNLRAGPGTVYDRVGLLQQGDVLDIQGRIASNEWVQVIPATPDTPGWVSAAANLVQVNVDLTTVSIVTPPTARATFIPTPSPTPAIPVVTAAPILLEPQPHAAQFRNRIELEWDWAGTLGPNDYFQVEIRNRYNATLNVIDEAVYPIDVAWVKDKYYQHDYIDEAYDREYTWRILVVRYITPENLLEEKDWAIPFPEIQVWDPPAKDRVVQISDSSEMRTLFVEPGDEPVNNSGSGGTCQAGDRNC